MSTITKEFTKEQLIEKLKHRISVASEFPESEKAQIDLELARIALASLELERGIIRRFDLDMSGCDSCGQDCGADMVEDLDGEYVLWDEVLPYLYRYDEYTAPPSTPSGTDAAEEIRACMEEFPESVRDIVEECASIAENACRAAMLQSGNFRENKNSSTNYPVIPSEVLSAILKVAKIRADFDDFDGDRRGIGDCLDEAEQELIVTINKYASQWAAEPTATNDVREQTAVPPVPVIQADVEQAIEKLKRKLVECNRYNYCADAVKGVEYACHAAMLQGDEPVSQTYKLNKLSGNSPVTPDSWISCSDRMPEDTKMLLAFSQGEIVAAYWNWVVNPIDYKKYRAFTYLSGNILDDVTHWMPLPEPPL